jgi:hypothetical protein
MKLVLGLVFVSFGLLGCKQAPTADSATDAPTAEEICLSHAELVIPGMPQDEALKFKAMSTGL